ncbi:MAG TPA: phospho-N-acetylmuramoyl-pentapeptide-transferase [Symbiobacteriaceae bacterium]|jgi:phospho-N-acetylmuramoyl-pentapeptide-transferase|nr:phospho-N-acetylmuramoyl-pentapeptide-transferase [Symbiobacteriaceae bacterium]
MLISPSMRLTAALIFSALAALAMGPLILPILRRLKAGQTIRAEMHAAHQAKAGTPTMGGLIFAIPAGLATLLFAPREGDALIRMLIATILTLGHGAVGFADDYIKVVLKRSLGLRARDKLLAQVALAAILGYGAIELLNLGTAVTIPYVNYTITLGKPLYYILVYIIVGGFANAVNFTDGLDGLLAGCSIIVFTFYAIFVCAVKGYWDLATLSVSIVGGCFGFLRYNAHPAKVFMGDVGSFALGGALAALAVLTKTEFLAVIVGGLFVAEMLSVVLQVASFKLTGKRIFKMAPIHHHFELLGWSEGKVLRWFWTTCVVLAVLAWFALPGWIIPR